MKAKKAGQGQSLRGKDERTLKTLTFRVHLSRLTLLVSSVLPASQVALAMETDQFTVPPSPLYDIGPVLSRKVVEIIESNRTGDDPERALSRWIGRNIFESRLALWVNEIRVTEGRASFKPKVFNSIYRETLSPVPVSCSRGAGGKT